MRDRIREKYMTVGLAPKKQSTIRMRKPTIPRTDVGQTECHAKM